MDWIDEAVVKTKKFGISQKAISLCCGLSEHSISKVFSRKTTARENTKLKIETAINELIAEKEC